MVAQDELVSSRDKKYIRLNIKKTFWIICIEVC